MPLIASIRNFVGTDLFGQLVRYGISGIGLTLFYSVIYLIMIEAMLMAPLVANLIAFLLTVAIGYVVHSRWSFRGHGTRDEPVRSTIRFFAVNICGFALNSFWVWLIAEQMQLSPRLPLIPIVLVTPWVSFWMNRRWTFG